MKLVLFSDLHLDTTFSWLGADLPLARRRRQALRDVLKRIAEYARDIKADALLCGGDLYEQERFTPDTQAFVQKVFADLDPVPVYLAPGNHDWFGPDSLYARTTWSPNVVVFRESHLTPIELTDGFTLWGAAHRAPANTDGFLDHFEAGRGGVNLALFHGSERGAFPLQEHGKQPHAPFSADQISRAGLDHAFLGHFHTPIDATRHTYPGNPDPLTFGEAGERGAVVATVHPDGSVQRERVQMAITTLHDLTVDISGCSSHQDVRDAVAHAAEALSGIARITLLGELAPQLELRPVDLSDAAHNLDVVLVRAGDVRPGYDLAAIGKEPTVRGQFVRDVQAATLSDEDRLHVLITGLRALDARMTLEVI